MVTTRSAFIRSLGIQRPSDWGSCLIAKNSALGGSKRASSLLRVDSAAQNARIQGREYL